MIEEERLSKPALGDLVDTIMDRIREKYPEALCLMSGEVYGDEDVDIEVYISEDELLKADRFAHEVAFELTKGTDFLILPMVAPMECCPVKR